MIDARVADGMEAVVRRKLSGTPFGSVAAVTIAEGAAQMVLLGEAVPGKSLTSATPFHICSCSKMFTALLCAELIGERIAWWEDPVSNVVPEFQLPEGKVAVRCTLRDLATMTAGLGRDGIAEWGFSQEAPKAERIARARHMPVAGRPGADFAYSNLCYIALGLALERLTGRSLARLLRERIFQPLGMTDTKSH